MLEARAAFPTLLVGSRVRRKPQKGSVCVAHEPTAVFAGVVYNYDQEGVHRDGSGWEQCISIPLVQPDMWELLQQWDSLLEEFSLEETWLPHRCVGNSWGEFGMGSGVTQSLQDTCTEYSEL